MVRHRLLVLSLMLGLSATLQAFAEPLTTPLSQLRKKTPPAAKHSATGREADDNVDSVRVDNLLADGLTAIEKLALERKRLHDARVEAEIEESLMYPAIDLYGDESWGEYVNPFTGLSTKAKIPDQYDIDCSNFVMPIDGDVRVTSHYGYRRRYRRMHRGIDLKLQTGDTVRAAFDGRVRINDYEGKGFGHYIVIRHDNGLETVYAHLSRKLVKRDQIVRAGEPIGLGGNTGRSTGSHLHFETRFMGIDLNPAHIFDFVEGVPLRDVYTFKRNGRSSSPASTTSYAAKKAGSASSAPTVHRIKKGDTLSTIAQRYGTSVRNLCSLNNISSRAILQVGKTLRVR